MLRGSRSFLVLSLVAGACASKVNPERLPASAHGRNRALFSANFASTSRQDAGSSESDIERSQLARVSYRKEGHECSPGSFPQFFKPVARTELDPFLAQFLYRTFFRPGTAASLRSQMQERGVLRSEALYAVLAVCIDEKTGRLSDGDVFAVQADTTLGLSARLRRRRMDGTVRIYDQGILNAEIAYDLGRVRDIQFFDPKNGRLTSSSFESNLLSANYVSGFSTNTVGRRPLSWEQTSLPSSQRISNGTCY